MSNQKNDFIIRSASASKDELPYEYDIDDMTFDEESTIDMALSSVGDSEPPTIGELRKHPRDRRLHTERIAIYTFIGFIVAMFIGLIPLSWKNKNKSSFMLGEDEFHPLGNERNMIQCQGDERKITLDDYLGQSMQDLSLLCDPTFLGDSRKADATRTPVKVFIMLGEANMVGAGLLHGDAGGTLEYTVYKKNRFSHLLGADKTTWNTPRYDVRYVAVHNDFEIIENNWLRVNDESEYFGPELQFGYIMGELFKEPVLLIKAAQGHNSLGGEMLPPGSEQYEEDGYIYAGYDDSPRRWEAGTTRIEDTWRAGMKYDQNVENTKKILHSIGTYYPGASTYEIAGFVWWQGDSDRRVEAYTAKYEENLVRLINALRFDFRAPHAKFVAATVGHDGDAMSGSTLQVAQAQLSISDYDKYPQHTGNVLSVDTRGAWKTPYEPGHEGDYNYLDGPHYGNNADTVMEVGNGIGLAMAKMIVE